MVRRRDVIGLLGAAIAWPLDAQAQQTSTKVRRIGVLFPLAIDDPEVKLRLTTLQQTLARAGWIEGRNVHFDVRWSTGDEIESYARELVELRPDVIVANGAGALVPLLKATRTIPIVFAVVPDPVGAGFVQSFAKPGGNTTGFITFQFGLSAKWLELIKQAAPKVSRVAVVQDLAYANGRGQFEVMQSASPSLNIELTPIDIRDVPTVQRDIIAFAERPNGGLIATANALAMTNRDLLVGLASRLKLPSVFFASHFAEAGGLISYGPNFADQFRLAADYVDRILKGANVSELPVQTPTKYDLFINMKTARSLNLQISPTLLAQADEVID
jgi:putative tryptophan/tyrosine transport system substrate-binding protein